MRFILALALTISSSLVCAEQVYFDDGWREQKFSLFSSNDFLLGGHTLGVRSNKTVSVLWTRLPLSMWGGRRAKWDWAVELSVPPTDLTKKGGDDRNLSIYFLQAIYLRFQKIKSCNKAMKVIKIKKNELSIYK